MKKGQFSSTLPLFNSSLSSHLFPHPSSPNRRPLPPAPESPCNCWVCMQCMRYQKSSHFPFLFQLRLSSCVAQGYCAGSFSLSPPSDPPLPDLSRRPVAHHRAVTKRREPRPSIIQSVSSPRGPSTGRAFALESPKCLAGSFRW